MKLTKEHSVLVGHHLLDCLYDGICDHFYIVALVIGIISKALMLVGCQFIVSSRWSA